MKTEWALDPIYKGLDDPQYEKDMQAVEKLIAEYAKAADLSGVTLVDTTGTDNYRKFVYTDVEGNRQEVDLDVMRKTVAAKKVNEDIAKEAEDLTKLYERIDNKNAINALVAD